jgi:tight adherence protein C
MGMLWLLTSVTFLAVFIMVIVLVYVSTPEETRVAGRLSRLLDPGRSINVKGFFGPLNERVRAVLTSLGKLLPAPGQQGATRAQLMMIRAGYRSDDAMLVMRGLKVLSPVLCVLVVVFSRLYRFNPFLILLLALVAGVLLPEMWLLWRIKARQERLRQGLPDGLDLLVICVEVGLGLDQALLRVAQELRIVHRELSEELQMVNLEMRVGKSRVEALKELARRTGSEDIKSLVGMLVQTERFGTSVAQSLRIHSDELRTKRRQRAEEMSAKTAVKMVGPLVFFIFPALMAVILGPAIITLMRQLSTVPK